MTDSSKNIIAASTYHPFGEADVEEGSEHYCFNGKEKDSTGLYYYGARYYDPKIGKFITRDIWTYLPNDFRSLGHILTNELKEIQKLNMYNYCGNNPLKYIDPTGHGWLGKFIAAAAMIIFIAACIAGGPVTIGASIILGASGIVTSIGFIKEFIYDPIFKTTQTILSDNDGNIREIIWLKENGWIAGGWYRDDVNGGYWVWSTKLKKYKFVDDSLGWTPPLPLENGEPQKPITYEQVFEEIFGPWMQPLPLPPMHPKSGKGIERC